MQVRVVIPEIADYEVRRELLRAGKESGLGRLEALKGMLEYAPITTSVMLKADCYDKRSPLGHVRARADVARNQLVGQFAFVGRPILAANLGRSRLFRRLEPAESGCGQNCPREPGLIPVTARRKLEHSKVRPLGRDKPAPFRCRVRPTELEDLFLAFRPRLPI